MNKYYRIRDDMSLSGRWHLSTVSSDDGCDDSDFIMGRPASIRTMPVVEVQRPGLSLDFTLTAFNVPVISPRFSDTIRRIVERHAQLIPIRVGAREGYEILNAIRLVRCLDEGRSEFLKWTAEDGRHDLLGHYKMVTRLRIVPEQVPPGLDIFRIEHWEVPLIVSQAFVDAIPTTELIGIVIDPIT